MTKYNPRDNMTDSSGISPKGAETLKRIIAGLGEGNFDPDAIEAEWKEAELEDAIAKENFAVTKAEKAIERQETGKRNPHLADDEELSTLAQNVSPEQIHEIELSDPDFAERVVQALVWEDRNEKAQAKRVGSSVGVAGDAKAQAEAAHEKVIETFRSRFWSLGKEEREEMATNLGIKDLDSFAPEHPFGQDETTFTSSEAE